MNVYCYLLLSMQIHNYDIRNLNIMGYYDTYKELEYYYDDTVDTIEQNNTQWIH
jgi:hypothetical protein